MHVATRQHTVRVKALLASVKVLRARLRKRAFKDFNDILNRFPRTPAAARAQLLEQLNAAELAGEEIFAAVDGKLTELSRAAETLSAVRSDLERFGEQVVRVPAGEEHDTRRAELEAKRQELQGEAERLFELVGERSAAVEAFLGESPGIAELAS